MSSCSAVIRTLTARSSLDVLQQPHVDAGDGWLIFKLPPAELAVHPADGPAGQELYFMCDDVEATVRDLLARGVEFTQEITDERWGRLTRFLLPGGGDDRAVRAPPSARDRAVRGRG